MEQWKVISTHTDYLVSNLGRIKRISDEKILGQTPTQKGGYLTVTIERKRRKVNRLVAVEFVENLFNLPQVHHKDNDVANNKAANLEWITNAENNKTCNKTQRKVKVIFTKEDVFYIHKNRDLKTATILAGEFDCTIDGISKVWRGVGVKNKKWKEEYYATNQ